MLENKQFHEDEIWKEIQGFEGLYAVSNRGRVKNLKSGRILGGTYNSNGYKRIHLKDKFYSIHRLVALAFIPNPHNLPEVNHKNEDKGDNNVDNLEWCTASQNQRHSAHQKSCRINQLTLDGKLVKMWDSFHQINRELGYNVGSIVNVCRGKRLSVYNFKWEYSDPSQQPKVYNRTVAALTKDGELVAEYKSAAEASRCLKIKYKCIYYCLNGTYKSTHGLRFIYIDD